MSDTSVQAALQRLSEFQQLPVNWLDGQESKPVSREAVRRAQQLIELLPELESRFPNILDFAVFPTLEGGVNVEWRELPTMIEVESDDTVRIS